MPLRVYNTLSQTKEPFRTVTPGKVGMYVCGPTVYSKSHIGHMVGPVIFDAIKRYLVYLGYQVTWVVNITDVDDKLIVQANKDGTSVKELAEQVTDDYLQCLKALRVVGIDEMPRATENIAEIIDITRGLIDRGFAYASGGDVYFDVTKAQEYGKLSHRDPEELMAGARIEPSSLKRSAGDFALWKSSKPGEPSWESPWGPGRPGWHIECSAMSMKYLGPHLDIHGGGLDLVFPHHENELVQSECFTGVPFATYWLHNGLLTKDGKKISKSDPATVVLMSDLLAAYAPDTLRVLLLSSHYRRPIDFGPGRLDELDRGLQAFYRAFERFEELTDQSFYSLEAPTRRDDTATDPALPAEVAEHRAGFLEAMDDDFNTGGAIGELFEVLRAVNREAASLAGGGSPAYLAGMRTLRELSRLLGIFESPPPGPAGSGDTLTAPLMELLIDLRARLRKEKNYALADEVRNRLAAIGVALEDRPDGTKWRVESKRQ
ncbi:Cysteine--tRNA ligase [Aquisphaera giovannonii]|uniref:Cysteine--tRNA ligase n=1 Tax=Aquisphaera giovannonii TaxID=406548 RepID=A0A5B9W8C6_9BACT|nr:cysteine--tRNA ligase [Aquisphaera giovannonii]QEH36946.1 Cysteine--tRNA ligase [Aquisphaera giovannonii]